MTRASSMLLAAICVAALARAASAHEVRPGYLEISEGAEGRWEVLWKRPIAGERALYLRVILGDADLEGLPGRITQVPGAILREWSLEAPSPSLAGQRLLIDGLAGSMTDVLVRVRFADGATVTRLLLPHAASWEIAREGSGPVGAGGFLRLGVEHILYGIDHLLFVLGLFLIVRSPRALLLTVTAFTLAHSITLAAAALGYVRVPVPPVEATIALSILFLGPEIVRSRRGGSSFTLRHPWVVAFAFGLLHGFGFAGGLNILGLPAPEIPLALLLFNVGVEGGQVAFVLALVVLARALRTATIRWPRWAALAPAYAVGTLGAFWTIERSLLVIAGAG